MAKTDDWLTLRFAKVEFEVTAAMVTALASLTTNEWIDISSIFAGPLDQPQEISRDIEETPVSGDGTPITSSGTLSARQFAFNILYTEGEVLGTDNLDIYQDLLKPLMEYASGALSMPVRWSPNGGAGGDNLYLASILAINPDNGQMVWYYQTTPADNWDFTATMKMILADLEIDGKTRQVIMQAPKNGFFYVLDRLSGELISAEPYVTVTWATHVDKKTGQPAS